MPNFPGRVLVTGVSSFAGFHIARTFAERGAAVVATLSRPRGEYQGIRAERLHGLGSRIELDVLDLRDPLAIAGLINRHRPEIIVHHAGHAASYASPDYDLLGSLVVNVEPLAAIYRAIEGRGCGVIVTGSSAEYSASDNANTEGDACLPDTPYGLSKLSETLRARQLALRHGVPTRVARLYIPFGRLDHPDKLLAQVVSRLRRGDAVALSACTQVRDFVGVGDVGDAWYRLACDMPRALFDIFNISSGVATPLRDLLISIADHLSADPGLLEFGKLPMRPGEAHMSIGANVKARELLSWSPTPLPQALCRDLLKSD